MSSGNSTSVTKPAKPRPDFPLFPHASGRWAKKIRGRLVYFGKWEDGADAALVRYLEQKDYLHAGKLPPEEQEQKTVRWLVGLFLTDKEEQFNSGGLSHQLHEDYKQVAKRLNKALGSRTIASLGPDDFKRIMRRMPKTWGVYQRKHEIVRIKTVFNFGVDDDIIPHLPKFGNKFTPPTAKDIRDHRRSRGSRLFRADEIRAMLDAATPALKAMILLGINAALGNNDIAQMPLAAIDDGWLRFPRPKTGVERDVPLWNETTAALTAWLAVRPTPAAGNESLVFVTAQGGRWAHPVGSALTAEFSKLLRKVKLGKGRGFYSLRRTFQNVGDESKDFLAVRSVMGHASDGDIADFYRERVSDERLKAVTEHVRQWLFAKGGVA